MTHRNDPSPARARRRASRTGLGSAAALALCLLVPSTAHAGTTKCIGTLKAVSVYARGNWEGALRVEIEGSFGTKGWILCSLNEGRTDASGVHRSKNGQAVGAVHDTSREACEAALGLLMLAKATGAEVQISFLNSGSGADQVFDSCTTVPEEGGLTQVPGEDDPGQRLGAWDSLYGVTVR